MPVMTTCGPGPLSGFAVCAAQLAFGQPGLPTSQPKMLTIVREEVKPGRSAEHARHEAGWPAAFEKAKSPDYYIAMTSLTGPSEAWYLIPTESHAAVAETMKREDKDPVLSAELSRLGARDAEFISRSTVLQAAGRRGPAGSGDVTSSGTRPSRRRPGEMRRGPDGDLCCRAGGVPHRAAGSFG